MDIVGLCVVTQKCVLFVLNLEQDGHDEAHVWVGVGRIGAEGDIIE